MQLRVFSDGRGKLHLEISNPSLQYRRRLFVPLLPSSAPMLRGADQDTLLDVWYAGNPLKVPFLLVHSEERRLKDWAVVEELEENDSINVLNHVMDILAWD